MSVIGDLRVSLDTLGVEQQAFLFTFITTYPLALGRLLEARGRRCAAAAAAGAMAGFVATTTPWVYGALLVVVFVGAMGVFIAAVCALDRLPRLVLRGLPAPLALQAEPLPVPADAARERAAGRAHSLPVTGHAGST